MKKYSDLSTRQNEIITFIKKYTAKNNYPPSIREIANGVNLNSPATVHVHVKNLIDKGYLKRNLNNHKLLELLVPNEFEQVTSDTLQIPLLDCNTYTNSLDILKNVKEYFQIPIQLIPEEKEIFALRINNDSMIKAGFFINDIVIIEKTDMANNGEFVVAITDENELIIRTYYKEKNYIRLQPENDLITPLVLANVTIVGKVISLYRKF